ncbi:MAG TPA: alpha/beta hydrolase [Thermoleophilaceae bacterium]|nr:alpha/beta hydrolase [Thermoleophilaceae bacterium]
MSSTTATDRAHWRSPALGDARVLDLPGGRLAYHDVGSGPPIVFVHGLLVNANLWRKVVERLAPDFRCIALDLPFGAHTLPLPAGAANTPPAAAGMVADALEALDLDDVTLVGNDSGGALCQMLITTRPERVGRLVLTSCDYRDNFPPKLFGYLKPAARVPGLLRLLVQPFRLHLPRRTPIAFGWLTKRPIDRAAEDSYVLPAIHDAGVRRDARAFILGADTAQTNAAADRLRKVRQPALIAWSTEDRAFPLEDGRRLAADLPNSRFDPIDDAYTFSMEDNPERLSELIAGFVREPVRDAV